MTGLALQNADYAILGFALVAAVTGLFRGFSGTVAFTVACVASAFAVTIGWPSSEILSASLPARIGIVAVGGLFAFGIVRAIVRRLVHSALAQPADAFFGFVIGAAFAAAILVGWAYSGLYLEYSALAREVAAYVR